MNLRTFIQKLIQKPLGTYGLAAEMRSIASLISQSNNLDNIALRISREQSASYVLQNLSKAKSFQSIDEILDFSLNCVPQELRDGLFLEFGVWKGRSINRIAENTTQTIYGFDSFEGLPEFWRNGFEEGEFSLQNNEFPGVLKNVNLVKGWFDQTLPKFVQEKTGNIAFLHVDCDLYSSTQTIFEHLGDRLTVGSIILFDEYFGYPSWQSHEYLAFKEFIAKSGMLYEYLGYNALHEQVVVRICELPQK
ncbi:MAG: TylF/MycF/NovP-related O-methyltransferase [Luteolibacter sp.]